MRKLLFTMAMVMASVFGGPGTTEVQAGGQRMASVATLQTTGPASSTFCTKDGALLVVHGGARGGRPVTTLIAGPQATRRLGDGGVKVPAGCYTHTIANTTVIGSEMAKSTIWYLPQ